ncbi:MAG: GAF domain-containing protein [Acaryochloris sp. RU_4_1]|nr:GAF domain-containing protein [Acaryochloris sp. RU_4_1]NJR55163.1 GAF domain-containing protein [Acaryochloris sp. CRU_2_0]
MIQRAGRSNQAQLVAIQNLMEQLFAQEQVDALVNCALEFLRAEFDYPLLWLAVYDPGQSELLGLGGGVPKSDAQTFKQRYSVLPGDLFDQVLLTGQPTEVMNLQEENRAGKWQTLAKRFQIQGALIYPIQYRQDSLGVLLLGSSHWGGNPRLEESSQLAILTRSLGSALHHLHTPKPPPDAPPPPPLLTMITEIHALTNGEERLQVILRSTQQVINPTFTGLYWFDLEQKSCSLRSSYQPGQGSRLGRIRPVKVQVPLAAIEPLCQSLEAGQIVAISESQGTVNSRVPLRLMQQTKSRSLLCAPIICEQQLLGFLSVAGAEPRVWQAQEKAYIQAAAQLIGLSVSLAEDSSVQVSAQTDTLMGQFTQLMVESKDWSKTLHKVSEHLCRHLQIQRLVLLQQDDRSGEFRVEYQYHSPKLRPLLASLQLLSDVDARMLERNIGAIAIPNLEEDLRFLTWRETLLQQGVRSILVCRTAADSSKPHPILLLGNQRTRTWKPSEIELLQQFAQTLGTFEQKQHDYLIQQHQLRLCIQAQKGVQSLLKINDPTQLITTGIETITELSAAPLVAGIVWTPGQDQGQIVAYQSTPPEFDLTDSTPIPLHEDSLFRSLLALPDPRGNPLKTVIEVAAADLTPATRLWLNSPGLGQVMLLGLRSGESPTPLGAVILGTRVNQIYSSFEINLLQTFIQTLASRYRTLRETQVLLRKHSSLECLNWYKQRSLESELRQLQTTCAVLKSLKSTKNTEGASRQPQIANLPKVAQSLEKTVQSLHTLLHSEDWKLQLKPNSIPLASIFRRVMERIEPFIQSKQLWTQIHNLTPNTTLTSTSEKLELVLYELLLFACQRSKAGDRLDLWCRLINADWIELSITDQGELDPRLLQDFQQIQTRDLLVPSLLEQGTGRHLRICQTLVERLGGRLELARLEDDRILSRLTLPLKLKGEP